MKVSLRTAIYPTEDPEKVKASVLNLFPGANLALGTGSVEGSTEDLSRFMELLRVQRIRDTAISIFRSSLDGDRTSFWAHKQVAFASKVNFTDGASTLGDIKVTVEEGALELIMKVTPAPDNTVQHHLNTLPDYDDGDELEVL